MRRGCRVLYGCFTVRVRPDKPNRIKLWLGFFCGVKCEKGKVRVKNKKLKVNGSKASAKKQKILGKNQSRKKKF